MEIAANKTSSSTVLLLKTPSTPKDAYEEYFRNQIFPIKRRIHQSPSDDESAGYEYTTYDPVFVPVLSHRFHAENLEVVKSCFAPATTPTPSTTGDTSTQSGTGNAFSGPDRKYGGIIFTSQRAVEAFGHMLEQGDIPLATTTAISKDIILYSVGPATTRTLTPIRDKYLPSAPIHGDAAGNGEALAHIILEHYNARHSQHTATSSSSTTKPGLLFLVGEQRRDIIPKTLTNPPPSSPEEGEEERKRRAINVNELVVYETAEMDGFEAQFQAAISQAEKQQQQKQQQQEQQIIWTVIFSPMGCDAVLRTLGIPPQKTETSFNVNSDEEEKRKKCAIVTIGPTTRDHLVKNYGFEPDVVARKPSPEGVGDGIREFLLR